MEYHKRRTPQIFLALGNNVRTSTHGLYGNTRFTKMRFIDPAALHGSTLPRLGRPASIEGRPVRPVLATFSDLATGAYYAWQTRYTRLFAP